MSQEAKIEDLISVNGLDPEVKRALQPLLDGRHQQVGDERYGAYVLGQGQTWEEFAFCHKLGEGPADANDNLEEMP